MVNQHPVSPTQTCGKAEFELTLTPDDGLCAFDYDVAAPGQVDLCTLTALKFAGQTLLDICLRDHYQGGVVTGLGRLLSRTLFSKRSLGCDAKVTPQNTETILRTEWSSHSDFEVEQAERPMQTERQAPNWGHVSANPRSIPSVENEADLWKP